MPALVFEGPWEMPLRERPDPAPGPGVVAVAVRAAGICGSDVHGYIGTTELGHGRLDAVKVILTPGSG